MYPLIKGRRFKSRSGGHSVHRWRLPLVLWLQTSRNPFPGLICDSKLSSRSLWSCDGYLSKVGMDRLIEGKKLQKIYPVTGDLK